MKKTFSILVIMLFTSILIFGSSINVKNPNASTILVKGQILKITWNKIGNQLAFVKIRLFNSKGDQKILGIVERAPNSGMFRWKYTGNVPDGQYIIKIKTKDDKVTGNSKVFTIGKSSSPPPPPPPPTAKKGGDFKDNPFHKKTYPLNTEKYQLKENILKSNILRLEDPDKKKKPENKASDPVVLIFKADPAEIKNGQKYFLRYHYKNATEYAKIYTFKNGRKDRFIKALPKGAEFSGKLEMGPVSWNDNTYCLEISNFKSMFYSTARVKVSLELQILRFDSAFEKYMVGKPVRLTYSFIAASKAYIKNITTGKIVKEIDTKGGNVLNEAFVFPFKETSEFKLFIKKYNAPTYLESNIVKITEIK